ncbi:pyruvate-formate lyase-activating enzyme [Bradyrhizobium sp. AZCC 1721]
MDAANVDLKAFTEAFYNRLCTPGVSAPSSKRSSI